jgi:perosamine synthetase
MTDRPREIPPTAGLPLRWRDFLPTPGRRLEAGLAAFLHLPPVQIECSGTAALIVALTALKRVSVRRSVVVPAYTCPLVVLAITQCGLKPVLCDLRTDHFDLDPQALRGVCGDDTLAVMPTHLGGRVADLGGISETARRAGAFVIEDAAQSLGATWHGKAVGTLGDVGFYSLAVGKGLTLYEGGVLMAHATGVRQRLRAVSEQIAPSRLAWELRRLLQLAGYTALYRPFGLHFAYGIPRRRALRQGKLIEAVGDDFSADLPLHRVGSWRRAIGANALARLPLFLEALSAQAAERKSRLAAIPGLRVMDDPEHGCGTWPYFMVLMPTAQARDAALARLWPAGLGVSRLFIHALPDYPYLVSHLGRANVPNARDFAARMLTISNSPWLHEADFGRVCAVLADYACDHGASSDSSWRLTC